MSAEDIEKKAACFACRTSKTKCIREGQSAVCRKCQQAGTDCVAPEYHVGRYKGTKNKRKRGEESASKVDRNQANSTRTGRMRNSEISTTDNSRHSVDTERDNQFSWRATPHRQSLFDGPFSTPRGPHDDAQTQPAEQTETPQEITVENADNPLQLLAAASELPDEPRAAGMLAAFAATPISVASVEDDELIQYFSVMQPNLDNSPDIDPIEMGLVTETEAKSLFDNFHKHLSHTRWGLDPVIHTTVFVRSRSAYLFTTILAASALFVPDAAALSKRLSAHRDRLTEDVVSKHYRSTEIILALMINIPWMAPAKCWSEDRTCTLLAIALSLAFDLSLYKIVLPSTTIRPANFWNSVAKADCIDGATALQLEGFLDVTPSSPIGRRILRTRERAWLALFVLDRGVCLARGRPYTVPIGPLIDSCDTWHISDITDRWDGSLVCAAVLRRDLVSLIANVREACSSNATSLPFSSTGTSGGASAVKYLTDRIDSFFSQWNSVWSLQVSQDGNGLLPPYVEILATHTRLSTYCSVINHPTASPDVKQFFRAAGLRAALNVMSAAVQGESRLKSMPNNTVIMVSFAACFALGLKTSTQSNNLLVPNVVSLALETAQVLERIGSITEHRNGISKLFGRHIRRIANKLSTPSQRHTVAGRDGDSGPSQDCNVSAPSNQAPIFDFASFDMTDDHIIEAINNATAMQEPFQLDESIVLDWFDWPNVT